MKDIINYLNEIQNDLFGIIVPVIITAVISLITITVDLIIKTVSENRKYNSDQYKLMQKFYPEVKAKLFELKYDLIEIENQALFKDMTQAIEKFVSYSSDEKEYIQGHSDERFSINYFIKLMRKYKDHVVEIDRILCNIAIPAAPVMRPYLKYKINHMLFSLQNNSVLWKKYDTQDISNQIFIKEMKLINEDKKRKLTSKQVDEYISCLDKWFSKY